nr:hypothetical protein [Gemmatimonadales bacterium]
MNRALLLCRVALLGALPLLGASPLVAQGGRLDVAYGWWWHDSVSTTFTAAYRNRLLGPFDYGLGVFHLEDSQAVPDRTMTGGELSLALGGRGRG